MQLEAAEEEESGNSKMLLVLFLPKLSLTLPNSLLQTPIPGRNGTREAVQ